MQPERSPYRLPVVIAVYKHTEQFQDYLARLFPSEPGKKVRTRVVTFQVTDACNLACSYCYQINKATHRMSFDVAKRFIDMLLDADESSNDYINPQNASGIVIEFIGGEPLLEIDLIDQITNYFIGEMIRRQHPWATRYRLSVCSNGILYFDERWQRYMKRHWNNFSFSISIDGCKELHDSCRVFPDGSGSYDIAIKGVRHFVDELGGFMGSKMTIAPGNVMHTSKAIRGLLDSGYKEIHLNCVYEEGWTVEHAKIFYAELKKAADYIIENGLFEDVYVSIFEQAFFRPKDPNDCQNWCGGNGEMIACDWKGDIYPCIRYMESSLGCDQEPVIIGNVYDGIMVTDKQQKCVDCLRAIDRRSQSTDECFNCPIAEGCSWCTALNYQLFGTPDKRATFICVMHKARALANAYFWNKGFRATGQPKRQRIHVPENWALEIISPEEWATLKQLESSFE